MEKLGAVYAGVTFVCRPYAAKDAIGRMQFGECLANARLIAAAPDLLAALRLLPLDQTFEDAADFKDNAGRFVAAMDAARTAIAKAEGK